MMGRMVLNSWTRDRLGGVGCAALVVLACAACLPSASSGASASAGPTPVVTSHSATTTLPPVPAASTDWTTYHRSNDRAGLAVGVPKPRQLAPGWQAALDGAVYGQPLVIGGLVLAATENDSVYGLDLTDGSVRWRRSLGRPVARHDLPCGNIDPLGITGTPAYDPGTGSVFVVTETSGAHHDLVALDARSGAVRFTRALDISGRDRHAEQQRGALAVAGAHVYVPFGGLDGDCGNYVGYVSSVAVDGAGATAVYRVPTSREGGIWAPSGVAIAGNGDVWVAVGNGASVRQPYDGSDSVLRLSADLGRRLDFFAPANWGSENAEDADLGSTGPLLLGDDRVLISGKDAAVFLLDATHLGGINGQRAQVGDCRGFGGMAWDAKARAAFVPCTQGLLRVQVGARTLTAGWRAPANVAGSPVLGAGAVWTLDNRAGQLYALDEGTGRTLSSASVGAVSRFASPVLSGSRVLVPTMHGITALSIS
jgi:outer membrane protein assembly factor BamB